MVKKNNKQKYALIVQALSAAESSINLAKQLLGEAAGEKVLTPSKPQISAKDLPGITGKFDGSFVVDDKRAKYKVPDNYASKSLLVYGDVLKMIDEDGQKRFKQVERVKRQRVKGILAQKDGKYCVVTSDGSYNVLEASVKFFNFKVGDELVVVLPLENKHVPFAAIEKKVGEKEKGEKKEEKVEIEATKEKTEKTEKEPEKKTVVKKAKEAKEALRKTIAVKQPIAVRKTVAKKTVVAKETVKEETKKKPGAMEISEEDELR